MFCFRDHGSNVVNEEQERDRDHEANPSDQGRGKRGKHFNPGPQDYTSTPLTRSVIPPLQSSIYVLLG